MNHDGSVRKMQGSSNVSQPEDVTHYSDAPLRIGSASWQKTDLIMVSVHCLLFSPVLLTQATLRDEPFLVSLSKGSSTACLGTILIPSIGWATTHI